MASIIRQVTVARDGFHNGFTDLQYWKGVYWVSYRKGSDHASVDSEAVISLSTDRTRFREVARIAFLGDNRDPKLFPVSDDRLSAIIPSWQGGYRMENLQTYITFSDDGFNWQPPRHILGDGQWLWRIREHDGVYFGLVQKLETRPDEPRQHNLDLMRSSDLVEWNHVARIGNDDIALNESDIVFREDHTAWVVARSTKDPGYSYFCHTEAPYENWQYQRLGALIHAPIMLEHDGRLYVAGRSRPELEGITTFPSPYSLGVWEVTFGKVEPVLRIPAMGDCSYPGLIKDPEGRICMSYYSQHAYYMGVIDGGISFEHPRSTPNDVYFAELKL